MTKYYYNGQLVRTSKTHNNYEWALIVELPSGKIIVKACSSTFKGASKDYNYYCNRLRGTQAKVYIDKLEKRLDYDN